MKKLLPSLVSLVLVVAILAPVKEEWRGDYGDSFPLSWYPMFSRPRPDPESSYYVVGHDPDGTRHIITSRYYARGGMNQVRRQLGRLARNRRTAMDLCKQIARRVGKVERGALVRVERVRIVRGWFHMKEYFDKGNKAPVREHTYAACRVKRQAPRQKKQQG